MLMALVWRVLDRGMGRNPMSASAMATRCLNQSQGRLWCGDLFPLPSELAFDYRRVADAEGRLSARSAGGRRGGPHLIYWVVKWF